MNEPTWKVESSKKGKFYTVTFTKDEVWYCQCVSWKNQRLPIGERECKHIREVYVREGMV